jgi:lysophospholipase L1-like esterase
MKFGVLCLGDSVLWGQGLLREDKIVWRIQRSIQQQLPLDEVTVTLYAHSTATIWKSNENLLLEAINLVADPLPGAPFPTVSEIKVEEPPIADDNARDLRGELIRAVPYTWCQLVGAKSHPTSGDIRLVLVNAGINDVGLFTIFLPFKDLESVKRRVRSLKGYMTNLLKGIRSRFPAARIVVPGYYRIVSELTDFGFYRKWVLGFLEHLFHAGPLPIELQLFASHEALLDHLWQAQLIHAGALGLALPMDMNGKLIDLSRAFVSEIHAVLQSDVDDFNDEVGSRVAAFVDPGFGPENSVYAPSSLLWELDGQLEPKDPQKALRLSICGQDPLLEFVCRRASLAHPTEAGAKKYADKITESLQQWPDLFHPPAGNGGLV